MQSTERAFSSSSFRWLCRDTWRCRTPTSVTYFILERKPRQPPGWAPSSHTQPGHAASLLPSGEPPLPGSGAGPPHRLFLPGLTGAPPPLWRSRVWLHNQRLVAGGVRRQSREQWALAGPLDPLHSPLGSGCPALTFLRPPEGGHSGRPRPCPPATVKWTNHIVSVIPAEGVDPAQEAGEGRPQSRSTCRQPLGRTVTVKPHMRGCPRSGMVSGTTHTPCHP